MAWELVIGEEVQSCDGGLGKLSKSDPSSSSSASGSLIDTGFMDENETFFFVCRDWDWWWWADDSEFGESRIEDAVEEADDMDC